MAHTKPTSHPHTPIGCWKTQATRLNDEVAQEVCGYYTHHELVFGFQNPISSEILIFLTHKILDSALPGLWFFSIKKSKFLATFTMKFLKPLRNGYISQLTVIC